MLIDARKQWKSANVLSKSTPKEMSDEIVSIVSDRLNKSNKLIDICAQIRERVQNRFGGLWMCHMTHEGMATTSATIDTNRFVSVQSAKLKVVVHKVFDEVSAQSVISFADRWQRLKIHWFARLETIYNVRQLSDNPSKALLIVNINIESGEANQLLTWLTRCSQLHELVIVDSANEQGSNKTEPIPNEPLNK